MIFGFSIFCFFIVLLAFQISFLPETTGRLLKPCRRDERRLSLRHVFSRNPERFCLSLCHGFLLFIRITRDSSHPSPTSRCRAQRWPHPNFAHHLLSPCYPIAQSGTVYRLQLPAISRTDLFCVWKAQRSFWTRLRSHSSTLMPPATMWLLSPMRSGWRSSG